MSQSNHREAVFNFFLEKGVILKEQWLNICLDFINARVPNSNQSLKKICDLVFEQWLNTDLAESSYSSIDQLGIKLTDRRCALPSRLIVQIMSVLNIGISAQAQFNALSQDLNDDSGFEPIYDTEEEKFINQAPKRCLLFGASDGYHEVQLLEYSAIPFLSLKTRPGSKILLASKSPVRNNVLYLTAKSCQLLGGEVERFANGLPVDVLQRKLNLLSPTSGKDNTPANDPKGPPTTIPVSRETMETKKQVPKDDQGAQTNEALRNRTLLARPEETRRPYNLLEASDLDNEDNFDRGNYLANQVSFIEHQNIPIEEEDSFDAPFPPELTNARTSFGPSTSNVNLPRESSPALPEFSACDDLPPTPSPRKPQEIQPSRSDNRGKNLFNSPPTKRPKPTRVSIKQEIIDVIDLDAPLPNWKAPPTTLFGALNQSFDEPEEKQNKAQARRHLESPQQGGNDLISKMRSAVRLSHCNTRDPTKERALKAYEALRIVYLADAIKQMRYTVGSLKRNVQAIIVKIVEPLRIVDDQWTQTVLIKDESVVDDGVSCIVAAKVLNSLIGLSPNEAAEIRRSLDARRRSEGKSRIEALQHAMERLDLIMEIEFFARREVTPIICDIQTLAQRLDMF